MPLQYDAEYFKTLEPLIPILRAAPKPTTIHGIREKVAGLAALIVTIPEDPEVEESLNHTEASDGTKIAISSFIKKSTSSAPGPAVLHMHGGGMIAGSIQAFREMIIDQVSHNGVPFFSVDYRLAPEHPNNGPVEDCYAALLWLHENAGKFNIDRTRIAVMGESAGGGLAAGVALMARDKKLEPPLAKQILIYPMLDDRNLVPDKAIEPFASWSYVESLIAWTALLGDKAGKPEADVSYYASPTRATSLAGLPPAYIDVGGLDILRDESIAYATRLPRSINTEFHLYPGLPQAFELIARNSGFTTRAKANRLAAVLSL